jgi:prevent-host-death family protein
MSPAARKPSTGHMIPVRDDDVRDDRDIRDNETLVYTMRELNQQTAKIMNEVEKTGKPAFITKHGRFVAVITPLDPGRFENRVLAQMAHDLTQRGQR